MSQSLFKPLNAEQLEKLPTPRLLKLFQKQRKKYQTALVHVPTYNGNNINVIQEHEDFRVYVSSLKTMLDSREHVAPVKKAKKK